MALLLPFVGGSPGDQITIPGDRAVLGRHPECDIVLDAAAVSRQHAQIVQDGGDYFIEDLHSRNGTFVNGRMVQGRRAIGRWRPAEDLRSDCSRFIASPPPRRGRLLCPAAARPN